MVIVVLSPFRRTRIWGKGEKINTIVFHYKHYEQGVYLYTWWKTKTNKKKDLSHMLNMERSSSNVKRWQYTLQFVNTLFFFSPTCRFAKKLNHTEILHRHGPILLPHKTQMSFHVLTHPCWMQLIGFTGKRFLLLRGYSIYHNNFSHYPFFINEIQCWNDTLS